MEQRCTTDAGSRGMRPRAILLVHIYSFQAMSGKCIACYRRLSLLNIFSVVWYGNKIYHMCAQEIILSLVRAPTQSIVKCVKSNGLDALGISSETLLAHKMSNADVRFQHSLRRKKYYPIADCRNEFTTG